MRRANRSLRSVLIVRARLLSPVIPITGAQVILPQLCICIFLCLCLLHYDFAMLTGVLFLGLQPSHILQRCRDAEMQMPSLRERRAHSKFKRLTLLFVKRKFNATMHFTETGIWGGIRLTWFLRTYESSQRKMYKYACSQLQYLSFQNLKEIGKEA